MELKNYLFLLFSLFIVLITSFITFFLEVWNVSSSLMIFALLWYKLYQPNACFNRISDEDFSVLYNKALCCFMVKWYDECYRLLCESEQLMSGRNITREAELPEAFLRYDHAEGHPFHPMPQGIPVCLAY